jgi:alanine dehydrogenase
MIIGVPKEVKNNENRVAITPAGVHALITAGHHVHIEKNAGLASGITDCDYFQAGAIMRDTAEDVYHMSDIIVKVKEPITSEYEYLQPGQTLFTYLHLAANPPLTRLLLDKQISGIAYETVQSTDGYLPLLAPMSEVAGRMSVQVGAYLLQKYMGGIGVLLGGVPGVPPAEVVIIGGGVVGTQAAKMAVGLGAKVTVMDIHRARLVQLDDMFAGRITTMMCNEFNVREMTQKADLLIGAVLVVGAKAPKIVTEDMVMQMKQGAVIVDVAIDQGGSIETIDRITTHDQPCYIKHGVVHYSVSNMPGAVPRTSTYALTGVTLPYLVNMANKGVEQAMSEHDDLCYGLNTYQGQITCKNLADSLQMKWERHNFQK